MNDITISRAEYELLLRAKTKLEIVKRTVEKDNDSVFGYTSGTRTVLEAVLGIERKEKKPTEVLQYPVGEERTI